VARAYDRDGRVLLCSSYSKDLSPGFRVGWIAPGRYKKQIMRLKTATNVATATLPQYAIADFLAAGGYDKHLRRIRRMYAQQRDWMLEAVARYFPSETRMSSPQGGFVLWLELPPKVDSIALYEDALQAGITFAPGPVFSARQKYRNFIRLNYAYWSPAVDQAVQTLGHLAGRHAK
jgi:DNA-binding transcriptional MocR family regulator